MCAERGMYNVNVWILELAYELVSTTKEDSCKYILLLLNEFGNRSRIWPG
jgi:hypothetical protein